ncbi:MAG: hypothetical protein PeribacterA2_0406 [Candidatus Peribacter riflensis]|uniref:Uncharacterized protein n=1 Tax=Candidatus Peribacter riflensis TaxID=1735162 RepID=A0A0S1SKV8_9BACT|nr:MAG: hypothetical protein PeribacterA2_0406 [Candidatus Peribacter riflensis]ALM10893.1 MAG: hypothetical protein PeribacterB2_0406 [Candidatus Peribacter riflensis]ALM11995.1 MAG: hypothetical protein PeribacterC2_0405 [Candidatus Peribacter riflensis]ALM13098.1 MAG: hypothetical protein PeribacterD1_0406 [Candidatus Peribacter riflensis]ALM14198.1 MAG: hypothetical protein PeribacterD2_0405 [Candidatus Peribacter riflensis]
MTSQGLAALHAAVTALFESVAQNDDLVGPLSRVDEAYRSEVTEERDEWLRNFYPRLLTHPAIRRINQAASLINSPFYGDCMDIAAESPESLDNPSLLLATEWQRRHKKYEEMARCANLLGERLQQHASPATMALRSKLSYEWCMALNQQADALREEAVTAAERSAHEAEQAGDIPGKLYAVMVKIDLLQKIGRWQEAFALSESALSEAEALMADAQGTEAGERVQRLVMNLLYHRMNIAVDHRLRIGMVRELIGSIEENPIYQQSRGQPWAEDPLTKARAYVGQQ